MNPWMLHEVRKDDVATHYAEAERSRMAALANNDSPGAATGHRRSPKSDAIRRAIGTGSARWAVGIAVGGSLLVAALAAFA